MRHVLALLTLWAVATFGAPAVAFAQPVPAPVMPGVPARAEITVTVIDASASAGPVDPALTELLPALQRTPFKSFRLVKAQSFRLPDGGAGTLDISGGRVLTVTLASHTTKEARVEVRAQRGRSEPIQTTLTIARDRAFMYVIRTEDPNRVLMLKIDVRY